MGSFGSILLELPVLLLHVIWTIVLELVLEWINSLAEIFVPEVVMEHQKIPTMEKLKNLFKMEKEKVTMGIIHHLDHPNPTVHNTSSSS